MSINFVDPYCKEMIINILIKYAQLMCMHVSMRLVIKQLLHFIVLKITRQVYNGPRVVKFIPAVRK